MGWASTAGLGVASAVGFSPASSAGLLAKHPMVVSGAQINLIEIPHAEKVRAESGQKETAAISRQ